MGTAPKNTAKAKAAAADVVDLNKTNETPVVDLVVPDESETSKDVESEKTAATVDTVDLNKTNEAPAADPVIPDESETSKDVESEKTAATVDTVDLNKTNEAPAADPVIPTVPESAELEAHEEADYSENYTIRVSTVKTVKRRFRAGFMFTPEPIIVQVDDVGYRSIENDKDLVIHPDVVIDTSEGKTKP